MRRAARGSAGPIRITIIGVILSHVLSFPAYDALYDGSYDKGWAILEQQFAHPLTPRPHPLPILHEAKIAFRITVPLLAHVFGFGRRGAQVLNFAAGLVLLLTSFRVVRDLTGDRVTAALLPLAMAGTFVSGSAFLDHRGMFDAIAIALLVLAFLAKSPLVIAAAIVASGFTDERGIVAAGFVVLFHWTTARTDRRAALIRAGAGVAAAVLYLLLRIYLARHYGLETPVVGSGGVGVHTIALQLHAAPLGIWTALEGLWLPVAAALLVLCAERRWWLAAAFAGCVALVIGVSLSVQDITRSAIYATPATFIAIAVLMRTERLRTVRRLSLLAAIVCVLTPTYYIARVVPYWLMPLPLQLLRWWRIGSWNTLP